MTTSANGVNRFGYDDLYRLTSWTPPSGQSSQWTYDAVGNRKTAVSSAGTTNYSYDAANELLVGGTTSFTYDRNGNQLTKTAGSTTTNYAWDALNWLTPRRPAALPPSTSTTETGTAWRNRWRRDVQPMSSDW